VTYTVYDNNTCTSNANDINAGTANVDKTTGHIPDSNSIQFNKAGTYYWQASFSGDDDNGAVKSSCTSETLTVSKAQPGITTTAVTPVTVGDKIHDTATISGLVSPDGTGKITFSLYNSAGCHAAAVFTSTSAGVSANGNVQSGDFTTTAQATYFWVASYAGDSNNKPAATSCGDTGETSDVGKAQPGITTSAVTPVTVGATIHDTATISGLVSPDGTGKVTFSLYDSAGCNAAPVFTSTSVGVAANGNDQAGAYTAANATP